MISDADLRRARPRARPWKLWDGRGLHLLVVPNGRRTWLVRIRAGGRERLVTVGAWPDMSLDQARRARDLVLAGLPIGAGMTFAQAARAWHAHRAPGWSKAHAADVLATLERDVLPAIGGTALDAIGAPDVLALVRAVELRGRSQTARRIRQRCSAVFAHAMSEGWCAANPAETVAQALLPPRLARPHPALVTVDDCRALLDACDHLAGAGSMVCLASRFLALTAVRLDAVRGMRWNEIEDLDGPAPLWRVPSARMKLAKAKKAEARFAHLVPLSPAAVAVLRDARVNPCNGDIVFAGGGNGGQIGEGAIAALYARTPFAGRHVPHGWRASFSTILNELLPGERDAIDLALAHAGRGKVEAAYNRAQLLDRRRALFERWGDLLAPAD